MAEYKKPAQTAPKQSTQNTQNTQKPPAPVVRAKIDRLVTDEESKVKAYASVTIGGMFAVHGVRVYQTENGGNYVSMPFNQYKDAEGKTYDQALQEAQQQGVKETQDNAPKIKPEM